MCEAIKGIREDGIQEGIRLMQSRSQQIYDEGRTEGFTAGRTDVLQLIRMYSEGKSILQIVETLQKDEAVVKETLIEAGMLVT